MRGAVLHGPHDVRYEQRPDPTILEPTDAIIRLSAACVCGSDLWDYRGINTVSQPTPMGHEYCGIVEAVGAEVTTITPGDFVIGSFFASDNTCEICRAGYQTSCVHREYVGGAQAELLRVPLADGTLVATPGRPSGRSAAQPAGPVRCHGHRLVRAVAAGVRPGTPRSWSVTARSACAECWPPKSSAPSGLLP